MEIPGGFAAGLQLPKRLRRGCSLSHDSSMTWTLSRLKNC